MKKLQGGREEKRSGAGSSHGRFDFHLSPTAAEIRTIIPQLHAYSERRDLSSVFKIGRAAICCLG